MTLALICRQAAADGGGSERNYTEMRALACQSAAREQSKRNIVTEVLCSALQLIRLYDSGNEIS